MPLIWLSEYCPLQWFWWDIPFSFSDFYCLVGDHRAGMLCLFDGGCSTLWYPWNRCHHLHSEQRYVFGLGMTIVLVLGLGLVTLHSYICFWGVCVLWLNLYHSGMLSICMSYITVKLLTSQGSFLITSSFTAELPVIFADKPDKAKLLLEGVENKLTPCLKIIVIMDSYGSDLVEQGKKCGVEIISLKDLEVSSPSWPTSLKGWMWYPKTLCHPHAGQPR